MNPHNINGYCPHCNANLDGDLIINYPLSQGKTMDEAIKYASNTQDTNIWYEIKDPKDHIEMYQKYLPCCLQKVGVVVDWEDENITRQPK
jgi:hypothetical protein